MYEFEYVNKLNDLMAKALEVNEENIKMLARKFADNIKNLASA